MKLEVIVPPSAFLVEPMAFPPLGALYVAAAAEAAGAEVRVTDLCVEKRPEWTPDLVGISALTPHVSSVRTLVSTIPVPVIVGGAHFDLVPSDALLVGAVAVSVGDGEATIGRFLQGERGVLQGQADDWPMPARHLLDLTRYHFLIDGRRATSMLTSRGCPFRCAYCSRTTLAHRLRYNPLLKVQAEVQAIQRLGFAAVMFYDDELNVAPARLHALCDLLAGEKMRWRGFVRTDLFTEEQARWMADSGCYELCAGVESGSDAILARSQKGAMVADATRCRRICRDYGIRFKAFMVIGLPGESADTVAQTERWLLEQRPDDFDLAPYVPFPGSRIAADPAHYGVTVETGYWDGDYWYKGKPGEYRGFLHTGHLSGAEIVTLRDEIYARVRKEWAA